MLRFELTFMSFLIKACLGIEYEGSLGQLVANMFARSLEVGNPVVRAGKRVRLWREAKVSASSPRSLRTLSENSEEDEAPCECAGVLEA